MEGIARHIHLLLASMFALVLALYIALGAYVEILAFVVIQTSIFAVATAAISACTYRIVRYRDPAAFAVLVSVAVLLMAWLKLPTEGVSTNIRFALERRDYGKAADSLANGKVPACAPATCIVEIGSPSYLVFPWSGLLAFWDGVVYDSTDNLVAFTQHKPSFAAAVTGCTRIKPKYYLCGFA